MFKNYFKSAIRSAWKNKQASLINIFGLSVGMTAAIFIFMWVQNERSFNNYHAAGKDIYRITSTIKISSNENWTWEASPMNMGESAENEIPEIASSARMIVNKWNPPVIHINNELFSEKKSAWVEKNWFSLFDYRFLDGNSRAFAEDPFAVVLTASKAKKYFGDSRAVGQSVMVDSVSFTVRAVVADNPSNSSFQFDILMSMDGYHSNASVRQNNENWNNFSYITFLRLHSAANVAAVENKLNGLINRHRENNNATITLRSLSSIYFEDDLQSSDMSHGNKKTTYIFTLLGLLLLVTASINYVNLSTAKAGLRAREVSIRKIAGAKRSSLLMQFLTECFLTTLVSLGITMLLLHLLLPVFNAVAERRFVLSYENVMLWQVLISTLCFTTLLNGIYPAILLSSFKPLNVLRGKVVLKVRDATIREGLVMFQFGLSMVLIVFAIVIYKQLQFIQTTNPGYNIAQVISVRIPYSLPNLRDDARKSLFKNLRHECEKEESILMVSTANNEIVDVTSASSGNADWEGRDTSVNPTIGLLTVDENFSNLFQLQMKEGVWFKPSVAKEFILNETAVASFNIKKPATAQWFVWGGDTGRIVGVVKNFHYRSIHEKIGPLVMRAGEGADAYLFVKTAPGSIKAAIKAVESAWKALLPGQPFEYNFLDDNFRNLYAADRQTAQLVFIFSVIAVLIAVLGLFALAAFAAEQRAKEMGIRKVLGASVQHIAALLSANFIRMVAVAIAIAAPIAWWIANRWLHNFAYRISPGAGIFIAAGATTILLAIFSVVWQALRTGRTNPAVVLRSE